MSKLIRLNSIDDSKQRDIYKAVVWILLSCLLIMSMCVSLVAQEAAVEANPAVEAKPAYETIPLDPAYDLTAPEFQEKANESRDESRARRSATKAVRDRIRADEKEILFALEGSGDFGSVSGKFNTFMQNYVFARMTQTDEETLATLGEIREDFIDDYLSEKVRGGNRQRVIQATVPTMERIVDGNFHPAAKMNAIVLLGMIDARAASRTTGTLPEPSPDALRFLTNVLTTDSYPAFLKIGALAGIQRHAEIDHVRSAPVMSGTDAIFREALAIVKDGGAGSDKWSPEAKYWLKRRSVQVLGYLGRTGTNGEVVDELMKIAADKDASTWLRFDSIAALGNLNFAGVDGQKAAKIPPIIVHFVADSLEYESIDLHDRLYELIATNILYDDFDLEKEGNADEQSNRPQRNIGTGLGEGGAADASQQDKKKKIDLGPRVEIATYHLNNSRRKVKVIAYTAKQSLESKSLAPLVDKTLVAKLNAELESLIKDADVGIKDLDAPELEIDEDDPMYEEKIKEAKKTNTLKMSELFKTAANDLRRMLPSDDADKGPIPDKSASPIPDKAAGSEDPFAPN